MAVNLGLEQVAALAEHAKRCAMWRPVDNGRQAACIAGDLCQCLSSDNKRNFDDHFIISGSEEVGAQVGSCGCCLSGRVLSTSVLLHCAHQCGTASCKGVSVSTYIVINLVIVIALVIGIIIINIIFTTAIFIASASLCTMMPTL
jgi:hypothetical protein